MRVDTTRWTAPSFHPSAKLIETVPLSLRDPSQRIASPPCTVHVAKLLDDYRYAIILSSIGRDL